jgi:hypothetical protein
MLHGLRTLFLGLTPFGRLRSIQGRGERIWAPVKKGTPPPSQQGRTGKGKIRKQVKERRTQDGRWPQVPSTRQITTYLHSIPRRK